MEDIRAIFVEEFRSRTHEIISILERGDLEKSELNDLYRHFHTLKGSSQMIGLENFGKLFHRIETIFKAVVKGKSEVDPDKLERVKNLMIHLLDVNITDDLSLSKLEKLIDYIDGRKDTIELGESEKSTDFKVNELRRTLSLVMDSLSRALAVSRETLRRMERSKVEDLVSLLGETLKLVEDSLRIIEYTKLDDFMISLKRLVDDMARREGKEIELIIEAMKLFIERKTFSAIYEPLIHIVKNSVKHGIELPEEREKLGKPRKGRITIRVEPDEKGITITVEDDGKGIDVEMLKLRAKEIGLDYDDPLELIFVPGLSTLQNEDMDGGRGIGMFAVKEALRKLRGSIKVETEKGKGTKVILFVPYTTMSEFLLVLRREKITFALPVDKIRKITFLDEMKKVEDEKVMIESSEAFNLDYKTEPRYAVILERKAILADEIIGVERYIVRRSELQDVYPNVRGWILRDRRPVPVLNLS
ncbi:MAG: Hpt domain-containing protein [Thermotogae bacterium]|nr:Hpt domain-containing protein [Thermotogota bacterium]RKX54841.1 MAG: hypothetical protein DRP30_01180 [Thermotoga sp.]HDM70400.1 hypothetical protein [Thermotogales bacterium]